MEAQGFHKAEINISGDLDVASPILRRETKAFLYIACQKNSSDSQKAKECLLFLIEFFLCESSCGNKRGLGSGLTNRPLPPAEGGALRVGGPLGVTAQATVLIPPLLSGWGPPPKLPWGASGEPRCIAGFPLSLGCYWEEWRIGPTRGSTQAMKAGFEVWFRT